MGGGLIGFGDELHDGADTHETDDKDRAENDPLPQDEGEAGKRQTDPRFREKPQRQPLRCFPRARNERGVGYVELLRIVSHTRTAHGTAKASANGPAIVRGPITGSRGSTFH